MELDSVLDTVYTGIDVVFTTQLKQTDGTKHYCKQLPVTYQQDDKRLHQFDQEIEFMESMINNKGTLAGRRSMMTSGNPAILYDYMEYHSLGNIIEDCVETDQRIPLSLGINWSLSLIENIEQLWTAAEDFGRTDIDIAIWPQTLFIDKSGNLVITHYSLNSPPSISSSIIKHDLKHYFLYAAPEQVIAGYIPDQRSLYFVLGMLLFELLTSKPLFTKRSAVDPKQVVRRKLRNLHPLLSDADPHLKPINSVINELLTPHPDNRLVQLAVVKNKLLEFQQQLKLVDNQYGKVMFSEFRDTLSKDLGKSSHLDSHYETTNINQFNAS